MKVAIALLLAFAAAAIVFGAHADFTREVAPLLQSRCVGCHGAQQQMGGLRLDSREAALLGATPARLSSRARVRKAR
jgi:hypothetical protein